MKKRYLALMSALMMLAAGTSCASDDSFGSHGEASSTAETAASTAGTDAVPAVTAEKVTEPEAHEPSAMEQAYKVLDCLEAEGTPMNIRSCGNIAVVQCSSADENDKLVVRYYVVDAVNDKLLRTIENCGPLELLLGIDAEGTVTAQDTTEDTQTLIYYKPDGSRTVKEQEDIISRMECDASGQLYGLDKGVIVINSDGSRQVIFDNEETEGVEFYDAARSIAVADYCNESFTVRKRLVLVDTSTGSEIADLGPASDAAVSSAGDYIAAERPDGSDSFAFDFLRVSDGASGRISADIPNAMRAVSTGITAADRFISAVVIGGSENGKLRFRLVMTDPGQISFGGSLGKADPPVYPKEKDYKCGEEYKELRAEADRIEEKYGVRILVGDEVLDIEDVSDLYGVASDESGSASNYAYESSESALETIDSMFAKYPEGFFEKFKRNGKGGLCIALCDSFTNKLTGDGFYPGGLTMSFGAWEIIAMVSVEVDSQTGNIIHHEMFHAVEDIVSRKLSSIKAAEWNALNPVDFSYTGDLDEYSDGNTENDHIYGDDDDPYFCSDYSKVTALEDRATLIEELFKDAYSASSDDMTYIEDVQTKCPHLRAKYEYLAKWVSRLYGYAYWEKMLGTKL